MIAALSRHLARPAARAVRLLRERHLRQAINLSPPYLGAGIRIVEWSVDHRTIQVQMRLTWWNGNYLGTHFGGSLYAMGDPFFALMVIKNLGSEYMVWDKAAAIQFFRPGRGTVRAMFHLEAEALDALRAAVETAGRTEMTFGVDVVDAATCPGDCAGPQGNRVLPGEHAPSGVSGRQSSVDSRQQEIGNRPSRCQGSTSELRAFDCQLSTVDPQPLGFKPAFR